MRHDYCEKDGISITYNDENVAFEDLKTAETLVISNDGGILLNNFDATRTASLMSWYGRIKDTIAYFRSLDRLEMAS